MVAAGFLEYEREQARKRMAEGGGDKVAGRTNVATPVADPGRARDKAGARA